MVTEENQMMHISIENRQSTKVVRGVIERQRFVSH